MDIETNLYTTKYWDYRLLNPDDATLCFIYHFAKIVPDYMERLHDTVEVKGGRIPGRYTPVIKNLNINNPKEWNNWKVAEKARRWCDENGIKYDDYWHWACEEHEKMGWRMTFMNSFCGSKMFDRVKSRSISSQEIRISRHPYFMDEGYKNCELQNEYFMWLIKELCKKYGASAPRVARSLVDDGIIPREMFLKGD